MELATLGLLGYGLLMLAIVTDSVFPIVPSEAAILTAAAATSDGRMSLPGVVATIAISALAGDVVVHVLGRYAGQRWTRRLRSRRGWSVATDLVRTRGAGGVLLGRFVPLGRTVVAFTTGAAGMPWRRYLPVAAVGAVAWAVILTVLGRTASTFSPNPLVAVGAGMAALAAVGGVVTLLLCRRNSASLVRATADGEQVLAERRIGHEPLQDPAERDDDLVVAA